MNWKKFLTPRDNWKRELVIFIAGLISGAAILLVAGIYYLRNHLVEEYVCGKPFDEVAIGLPSVAADSIPEWSTSYERCFLPVMPNGKRLISYKLCNQTYAHHMLSDPDDRRAAAVIPCSFAVYEREDGTAGLVRYNTGLLGWIFGGVPGTVFRDAVAVDQEKLIRDMGFEKK